MTRLVHRPEHCAQIGDAEVIHMFVEHIEPGAVLDNPVETRHFDINLSALVGSGDFSQKTDRTTDVLQHMAQHNGVSRSKEHTSELQSLMRISYAVFCLKNKNNQ